MAWGVRSHGFPHSPPSARRDRNRRWRDRRREGGREPRVLRSLRFPPNEMSEEEVTWRDRWWTYRFSWVSVLPHHSSPVSPTRYTFTLFGSTGDWETKERKRPWSRPGPGREPYGPDRVALLVTLVTPASGGMGTRREWKCDQTRRQVSERELRGSGAVKKEADRRSVRRVTTSESHSASFFSLHNHIISLPISFSNNK